MTGTQESFPNGSAAVIAQAMGEIRQQMASMLSEQMTQRDLLTRFDERQRGWATKQEVSEVTAAIRSELAPVAAKAEAAHNRLDLFDTELAQAKQHANEHAEGAARRLASLSLEVGPLVGEHGQVAILSQQVDALRLSWARVGGMAVAASALGSVLTAVIGWAIGWHS